jgi:hypothetical protein
MWIIVLFAREVFISLLVISVDLLSACQNIRWTWVGSVTDKQNPLELKLLQHEPRAREITGNQDAKTGIRNTFCK